jgi:hypothetical protein
MSHAESAVIPINIDKHIDICFSAHDAFIK